MEKEEVDEQDSNISYYAGVFGFGFVAGIIFTSIGYFYGWFP